MINYYSEKHYSAGRIRDRGVDARSCGARSRAVRIPGVPASVVRIRAAIENNNPSEPPNHGRSHRALKERRSERHSLPGGPEADTGAKRFGDRDSRISS